MDDEGFNHPVLGKFELDSENGWIGRSGPGADFFDLYVMRPDGYVEDGPPADHVERLAAAMAGLDALKFRAVAEICAARQSRLNWRAGPPPDQWSITEARIDADGALWLSLHEYETDEYSLWLVKPGEGEPWPVRRRSYVAYNGAPSEAGDPV